MLSTASDKVKLFSENFSKNSNLDDSRISLYLLPSSLESGMNTMKKLIPLVTCYTFKSLLTLLIYILLYLKFIQKKYLIKIFKLGLSTKLLVKGLDYEEDRREGKSSYCWDFHILECSLKI